MTTMAGRGYTYRPDESRRTAGRTASDRSSHLIIKNMIQTVKTAVFQNGQLVPISVEVKVLPGIGIHLVGLPDTAVKESLLRVSCALSSERFSLPGKKVIINICPLIKKGEYGTLDLAIAIAILLASGQISPTVDIDTLLIAGNLKLDGSINPVREPEQLARYARKNNLRGIYNTKKSPYNSISSVIKTITTKSSA